ncbi:MAG: peptidoglycan-binding protein [Gallionellaceae bacterium]|nr:peptidoglycan-binding protein [Gallionellaceae bacterium]
MQNPAYVVALALGGIMLLSVCYVYVRHQVLQVGGMAMSGFAVILVGMSVWKSIDISVSGAGISAKLDQAIKTADEAKVQATLAKEISAQNREAAAALTNTVQVMKTQDTLRNLGLYRGPLDGELSATTKQSLLQFQQSRSLPGTATLDERTVSALRIKPIAILPRIERIDPARMQNP